MWRGMWSSGRGAGDGDDPERKQCIAADAARKRSTRRYLNRGLQPPPSLLRREKEYDRRQALLSSGVGSSSAGASSSRTALTPMKKEPEELPPLRAVKREPEPEQRGGGVVRPEDFLSPAEADAFEAAILARSAREEGEVEQRRLRDSDLDKVFLEQGLTKAQEFEDNLAVWRREAKVQDDFYIDLGSDDED